MSCSDSTLPSTESSTMGAATTKASTSEEEVSPEIPESVSPKGDSPTPISDAPASPTIEEQVSPDSDVETYSYDDDSEYDDALAKEQLGSCACESCLKDRKFVEKAMKENRKLQIHWIDLRTYIRMVYRMALETKPPTELYHEIIKRHVQRLCANYPHQLFLRLEAEVHEFVMGTKVRLLEMVRDDKNAPILPSLFITGLLEGYKKLMAAADEVAPLLECLEKEHMSRFNLTWRVFNQHLYQLLVYADPFFLDKVPECIVKLSNKSPDPNDDHKKLVREFLSFDDEITLAGSLWRESETKILQYSQELAAIKARERLMEEQRELFNTHKASKHKHHKMRNSIRNSEDPSQELEPKTCKCEECAMSQLLGYGGLITPPLSPALPPSELSRIAGEGQEIDTIDEGVVEPDCECHVCTAPPTTTPPMLDFECTSGTRLSLQGGGFHLYPHIHGTSGTAVSENGTSGYPHLHSTHSSLPSPGKCNKPADDHKLSPKVKGGEPKGGSVLRPSSPPVPPPKKSEPSLPAKVAPAPPLPPNKGTVKPHRHSMTQTPAPRLHQNLPDVVPPVCHGHHGHSHNHAHNHAHSHADHSHGGKRVPCGGSSKQCHGHEHDDETSPEDSCSDRSSSTQRGDSRHCDCCYCEVFGHGVPSVAPVSRNYTEMRERLRLLLNKKKAKCKTAVAPAAPTVNSAPVPGSAPAPTSAAAAAVNASPASVEPKKPKDPRDLEDLLDFIEGNPTLKCKDEKKAAKKARQKQKKQEEIEKKRKEEEEAERRRIQEEEEARAQLKQQRKEAKKMKKKKKAMAAMAAKGEEQAPQMVTIKRIMEPNSAEPTVTITLRGQTPNEDKVLYTLLNGQVCSLPGKDPRNAGKGKQQPPQPAAPPQTNQSGKGKSKNTPNNASVKIVNSAQVQVNKVNGKTKKETTTTNQKTAPAVTVTNNTKKKVEVNVRSAPTPAPAPAPPAAPQPQAAPKLTSPAAIQINNAINRLSSRQPLPNNFSIDSLKLPPGITITKVDPSQVTQRRPIAQPIKPTPPPSMPAPPPQVQPSSNVIVVDTGRLKDLTSVPIDDFIENTNSKKKKKKKPVNGNTMNGNIPANEPPKSNMVRLTMNGGPPRRMMSAPQPHNGRVGMSQQAAIIKVNGSMVTIRSPALQQALSVQEDPSKKKKKKKGGQGQHDESWNPIDEESVFAPKDIDLESGEMDDAERELEAFKRFCLQSVPPQRKEKVHLNIKDIVLKKKSSAISCS